MTTTMTNPATTSKRAEASRRNGRKSRGPKTTEGKGRSRFNALKHGMRARTIVLPGEDAVAYQGRLDAWTADLQPCGDAEQSLVEQAARASWQLDRADRAQVVRLSAIIEDVADAEDRRRDDEADGLGRRLLTGPDHPADLVPQLETTTAGCLWLLERWGELREIVEGGLTWQAAETHAIIRLMGGQPLDASDGDPDLPSVLASFARRPEDAQARERVRAIISRAMLRLVAIGEHHVDRETAEAAERAARLSFDDSAEGERLRQYQHSCGQSLLRAITALLKTRRASTCPVASLPALTTPPQS